MTATLPAAAVPAGTRLLRSGRWSVLVPVRACAGAALLVALLLVAVAVSLGAGTAAVGPVRSLAALAGSGDPADVLVVQQLRLPRLQAGLLVGAALGVSGLLMQTLARNRLATPGTVGLDDGATAFAVATGCRYGSTRTPVPICTRSVRAAR